MDRLELGLDGRLRPVRGRAAVGARGARGRGTRRVVVAAGNAAEAALVAGIDVRAAEHLGEIVAWLRGDGPGAAAGGPRPERCRKPPTMAAIWPTSPVR